MKRWYGCFLFMAAVSVFIPANRLSAASWPLFRGSAERAGAIVEQAEPKLTPRWKYSLQGQIISSPVVYKGIVYFGGRDGSVWALNARTGEVIWQYSTGGWVDATPCVSSDTVFVPSRDKNLYAFDRLTGSIKWQAATDSMDCSSPLYYNGKVYLLSGYPNTNMYCFNATDGSLRASYPVSQYGFSSPALMNGRLYFGTNDGQFHCLDLAGGHIVWDRQTRGGIFYSTLAASENALYAVSGGDEKRLFCLKPETGDIVWQSPELDSQTSSVSSVSLTEDRVYVASTFGSSLKLYCYDMNGAQQWSTVIGTPHISGIVSSPCVADGVIYIGSGNGYLYCLNASDGRYIEPGTGNLSSTTTGYYLCNAITVSTGIISSPTVSDGWVYAGTYDGNLWAFEAAKITSVASPDNGEQVVNGTEVKGTITDAAVPQYALEYGKGIHPDKWTQIMASSGTVAPGASIGYWDTTGLLDGQYSLRLTVNADTARKAVTRVNIDNSPRAPANLTASDTPFDGGGSLSLFWNKSPDDGAGSNDVTAYRIFKGTSAASCNLLEQVTKGTTAYIDTACPVYTTFYYVLTALDQTSESGYSTSASAFSQVDGVEINPANGGTVTLTSGGMTTEVVIEPGGLSERAWIGILIPQSPPDSGIPASAKDTKIVREFGITPATVRFLKPVTLKLPYRAQDIVSMKRENLRMYWWDTARNEWRIVNTSDPNSDNEHVCAVVPHFSMYRIMAYAPGNEPLLQDDRVYVYPNPAKGDRLSFKFYLGDKADVTVDVYNVAGELIAHLEKADCPAGLVSEIEWNIADIASGAYVFRLEAKAASATKAIKKKLAIIH